MQPMLLSLPSPERGALMTPFQRLLADEEALVEYVKLCRKLPSKTDWQDGDTFTVNVPAEGGGRRDIVGYIIEADLKFGPPMKQWMYLPSDIAEWMAMDGWQLMWGWNHSIEYPNDPARRKDRWAVCEMPSCRHVVRDPHDKHLMVFFDHPHLAAARAVTGGE